MKEEYSKAVMREVILGASHEWKNYQKKFRRC